MLVKLTPGETNTTVVVTSIVVTAVDSKVASLTGVVLIT
jgi:hypothetical protein